MKLVYEGSLLYKVGNRNMVISGDFENGIHFYPCSIIDYTL